MEDSVGEEERREQGETMVKARQEDEQVEGGRGGEPGEEGGFLSAMASKIGAAMGGGINESSGDDGGGTVNATAAPSGGEEKKEEDGGHGGGGIFQKFMSSSHAPSPDSGGAETGEERTKDAGGEHGGILSSMASRIGMAMSGANGSGDHHGADDDAKTSNGDAVDHMKGEEKADEANGGGILSSMASRIGIAMSGANGHGDHSTVGDAKMSNGDAVDHVKGEEKEKGDEANGGILSAMAFKIGMSMPGANGDGNHAGSGDDTKTSNGDAAGAGGKVEEKGTEANGGGLVDQIMSNLPSEDQAPEADEASLLIAIIED
ncbi:hypothetical protein QOZ80_3BG0283480 [Eleusine coracana subsp. coracana]|nr:hypothetical protein QOZ80_3BG0283480 [Eleusine coracana subsp. coracana]